MRKRAKIRWSHESVLQTDEIIDYLEKNWTAREISRFLSALKGFEDIVTYNPEVYPESSFKKGFHRAVILKQISVIYSIENDIIKVHILYDNRQNPRKIKKKYFN
jgi:arsenate reductase-like glutaredoxin family protein